MRFLPAAALIVVFTLTGCGSEPAPEALSTPAPASSQSTASPEPSPTSPEPSPTPTPDEATVGFLLNVRHAPEFERRSDDELLTLARQVCDDLDSGATYEQTVAPMLDEGVSPDSAIILAATAVFEFCGQHDRTIEVALGGPADPQADPVGDPRDAFLAAAHANPTYGEATDDGLLMLGTTYCDGFTRGDTLDVSLGYMEPTPREDAIAMLTAAVTYICPEHAGKLG